MQLYDRESAYSSRRGVSLADAPRTSRLDLERETISPIGEHSDAISAMNFSREKSTSVLLLKPSQFHQLKECRCIDNGFLGP